MPISSVFCSNSIATVLDGHSAASRKTAFLRFPCSWVLLGDDSVLASGTWQRAKCVASGSSPPLLPAFFIGWMSGVPSWTKKMRATQDRHHVTGLLSHGAAVEALHIKQDRFMRKTQTSKLSETLLLGGYVCVAGGGECLCLSI